MPCRDGGRVARLAPGDGLTRLALVDALIAVGNVSRAIDEGLALVGEAASSSDWDLAEAAVRRVLGLDPWNPLARSFRELLDRRAASSSEGALS